MKKHILIVEDEKVLRFTFMEFLSVEGYEVTGAEDYDDALRKINKVDFDLIFTDIILGGKTGIDLLREIKDIGISCPVIVISGYPDIETASEAVRLGAFDYVSKPVEYDLILRITRNALKYKESEDTKERYRSNIEAIFSSVREGIISVDKKMKITEINFSAGRICGFSESDKGKKLDSISNICSRKCIETLNKTSTTKKPAEAHRIECKSQDVLSQIVTVSASPILDNKGDFQGAVLIISDDSRIAELEFDLRERRRFGNIVGESNAMQDVFSLIEELSDVETTVLITGESGTGKELVAEALYNGGTRKKRGPFVVVNCAAIPENLIESELFGHEKGAFTGAVSRHIGKFEKANHGMIFLDEIGDMSFNLQSKLLRVLESSEIQRVGSAESIKVDVRIVAATNHDLRERVRTGQFREDLYYRINVVEIDLPLLRDRLGDIPILIDFFLNKFSKKFKKNIGGISEDVLKLFMEYEWPGNVRELEHALEHASILCKGTTLEIDHLPKDLRQKFGKPRPSAVIGGEAGEILQALEKTKWNRIEAANFLGMDRSTLYRKMKKHKI